MNSRELVRMIAGEQERAEQCNRIIGVIAGCGRRFFSKDGRVSRFEWQWPPGRWVYVDEWKGKRRYLNDAKQFESLHNGRTLKDMLRDMLFYIRCDDAEPGPKVVLRHLGPWPESFCGGDLWGYGADMQLVRDEAKRILGVVEAGA